jgi:hypothetical protein
MTNAGMLLRVMNPMVESRLSEERRRRRII